MDVYSAAFTIHECPQFATKDMIAEAFRVLKPVRLPQGIRLRWKLFGHAITPGGGVTLGSTAPAVLTSGRLFVVSGDLCVVSSPAAPS